MAWISFPTNPFALQAEEVFSHPLDNDFKVKLTLKQKPAIRGVDFSVLGLQTCHFSQRLNPLLATAGSCQELMARVYSPE